jgi:hypothetical protein
MCNAYAEIGLFVLMYLVYSRSCILLIFQFGQHMNYYMLRILIYAYNPQVLILFSGIQSRSRLYFVLLVRKVIFNLLFL